MKKHFLIFALSIFFIIPAYSQSGETAQRVNQVFEESGDLSNQFINQITNIYKEKSQEQAAQKFMIPLVEENQELFSLVDQYHLLLLQMGKDFSKEDLTDLNYLKNLQNNAGVKAFQNELYDQIIILKENFQQGTRESFEGVGNK